MFGRDKNQMIGPDQALPGRSQAMTVAGPHFVFGTSLLPPFPGMQILVVAMGCFWGAERRFWEANGVHSTAVGYAGGFTKNPTYKEVCSGRSGHAEAVQIVLDPTRTSVSEMLRVFWENHDPTQGMRQGNDIGSQYRSALYWTNPEQETTMKASAQEFQTALAQAGAGTITTEIAEAGTFYYAEDDHQQYLAKNPDGYCGLGGTGVSCSVGLRTE